MKSKKVESSSMHTRARRLLRLTRNSCPSRSFKQITTIIISSDSEGNSSEEENMEASRSSERKVNVQNKIKEEHLSEEEDQETEEDKTEEEEATEKEDEETEEEETTEEEEEETEEEEEETDDEEEETEDDNEYGENEEGKEESKENEEENQGEECDNCENEQEEDQEYESEMSWDRKAIINETGAGEIGESVEIFPTQSSAGSVNRDFPCSNHNQNDGSNSNAIITDNFSCFRNNIDSSASNQVEEELDEKEEREANIISKTGTKKRKSEAEEITKKLKHTFEAYALPEIRREDKGENEAGKILNAGSGKNKFVECMARTTGGKEITTDLKPTYEANAVPETIKEEDVARDNVVRMDVHKMVTTEKENEASKILKVGSGKNKFVECMVHKSGAEEIKACAVPETRREEEDVTRDNVVKMDVDKKETSEKMEINLELHSKDKITTKAQRGNEEVGTSKPLRIRNIKKEKMSQSEFLNLLSNIDWNNDDIDADKLDNESPSYQLTVLPLIFSFGDDDEKVVEKTEQELELEELWCDFDMTRNALNIGVYKDDQSKGPNEQTADLNDASVCEKGMHKYIIDDQIGIKCMFCSYVQMDIKYVLPSWDFNTGAGFGRKDKLIEEKTLYLSEISKTEEECRISRSHFDGTVWDLIPGIKDSMFQHQIEAFEFMWNNLAGTIQINELKKHIESDETGGCVISHAPGTGKTRLSIMFLKSYMTFFPDCRPVIVAPPGLLQTWKNEFKKWGVDIEIYDLNDDRKLAIEENGMEHATLLASRDSRAIRLRKLLLWSRYKSVILVSYNLLAHKESEFSSLVLEKAGLIIFDEGHTPRNDHSIIWSKLKNIQTSKRIILSGTPFQNNFQELYNTLQLVRPKFADKLSCKASKQPYNIAYNTKRAEQAAKKKGRFVEKDDAKSKWHSLTKNLNASDNDLDKVKSVIKPFVHVHSGKILDTLPGLRKCVLILNPLPLQNTVRKKMNAMKHKCSFEEDYRNTLVAIHPSLGMTFLSEEENLMLDTETLENVRLHPNEGAKTNFVIELTRLCETLNEKIIVFCQYLEPLDLIKDQLIKIFGWSEGKEILKFVGRLLLNSRQTLIDDFNNDSSNARILLASTKACSEGISLVGASRVVLLDILWNPSIEIQAISRAHRIGQKKFVYIYQLITSEMKENEKFCVQANKKKISNLVFAPTLDDDNSKASVSTLEELDTTKLIAEDKVLAEMTSHAKFKDVFQNICYLSKETTAAFVCNEHKI